jgi:uncharacterized protein YbaP (TraB family)
MDEGNRCANVPNNYGNGTSVRGQHCVSYKNRASYAVGERGTGAWLPFHRVAGGEVSCERGYTTAMRVQFSAALLLAVVTAMLVPTAMVAAEEHSFLWRAISGDRSVYLLGSIHYMKADAYPLSSAVERAFDSSGMMVFETDNDEITGAAVSLLAAGTLEGNKTLADVVSTELYCEVSQRLEMLGMGIGGFKKMKPWMLALSLTSLELMRAGYLGSEGIDAHFNSRAKAAGKSREGLESTEFQVSLFAEMSAEESVEFLQYTLTDLDTVIPLVDEVVATWKIGDFAQMEELLVEGFADHKALFARMVTDRNLRWLPRIEELFEGNVDAMVVVGSLHLVGEQGLIQLLKAKGYKVEQL